jgi:hypothetical protein
VSHDIQALPNGNVLLHTGPATVVEMSPDKRVVWRYQSRPKAGYDGPVEVHAFQRLRTAHHDCESGNRRIIEVTRTAGSCATCRSRQQAERAPGHAARPQTLQRPLSGLPRGRRHGARVRQRGPRVWSYALDLNNRPARPGHGGHGTEVFGAIRLPKQHTVIAGGNNNRVIEVDPAGKTVWSIEHDELPGIAWLGSRRYKNYPTVI